MREIARRVGVSHSAAYRHFNGKEALLAAIAQDGFEQLTHRMREVYKQDEIPPGKRFQMMGVDYILFAVENRAQYRLMYGNNPIDREAFPELYRAAVRLSKEVLRMIQTCQQNHSLKLGDPREYAQAVWSITHGAAMLVIDGYIRPSDLREFADKMTRHLRSGIAHSDTSE